MRDAFRCFAVWIFVAWFFAGCAANHGTNVTQFSGNRVDIRTAALAAKLDRASGEYAIRTLSGDRTFTGNVGAAVTNIRLHQDQDQLGNYQSVLFDWQDAGPVTGEIRLYIQRPVVQFLFTSRTAQPKPTNLFPTLSPPSNVKTFSYQNTVFSPCAFKGVDGGTPWLWFDPSGKAAVVSPGSHFMVASLHPNANGSVSSGWVTPLAELPEGFTQSTLLAMGDSISSAWNTWGMAMTDLTGKKTPANDADQSLKYLGYWTDNGAGYYYNYDPDKGYTGTLLAVRDELQQLGVPIKYMQLDSWWYIKTNMGPNGKVGAVSKNDKLPAGSWNCYGGLTEYVAHADLFPDGLAAFAARLGLPLITHNRWVDLNSPYRKQFQISGVAAVDPKWWDQIADYIKTNGVATYEQDWLNQIYQNSPEFESTTTAGDAFTDNMSRACAARGLTMQYCMELPRFYLQGSKYDNLTTVRVSGDRLEPRKWTTFLYTSQLAAALGEWPFTDCVRSFETANLLLANLSAGPVGIGDLIGETNVANIKRVARMDGVLVKPDVPIVPIDSMYQSDGNAIAAPMVASTYTRHGPLQTAYVFAYPRGNNQNSVRFRPAEIGIPSAAWVYDVNAGTGRKVEAGGEFQGEFSDPQPLRGWSYYIVAPVGKSGIALLGDAGKFVSMGRQRIVNVEQTAGGMKISVAFAPGESSVWLHGFCDSPPTAKSTAGIAGPVDYNSNTHEFRLAVSHSSNDVAEISLTH